MSPLQKDFLCCIFLMCHSIHSLPCCVPKRLTFVDCFNWIPCSLTFGQWEILENDKRVILGYLSPISLPAHPQLASSLMSFKSTLSLISYSYVIWSSLTFPYMCLFLFRGSNGSLVLGPKKLSHVSFSYPCRHLSLVNGLEWTIYFCPY